MKDNHPIVIFWSDEDEAYVADVPDLRYCSAHGETPEEALREILIARELWLEVAHEDGLSLPDPSASPYLPEIARKGVAAVGAASGPTPRDGYAVGASGPGSAAAQRGQRP